MVDNRRVKWGDEGDEGHETTEHAPLVAVDEQSGISWVRRRHALVAASPRYPQILLWSVLFGLLSVNFTFTIFNVALVRIARDLGTTSNTLTWAITGPLLVIGVAAPTLGKTGDLYGHRRLYLIGMSGALLCSVLTILAPNAGLLIAARLLSGVEGACTTAASWSLLFSVFPPESRSKVMGWWSLVGAGGPVLGVAIGGPVIEAVSWRWLFVAQVPLIALAILINAVVLPDTERVAKGSLDVKGALTLTLAVAGLLLGFNRGPVWGWGSIGTLLALCAAPVGIVLFVLVERSAEQPLIPLRWFRRRNFVLPMAAQLCVNFAYLGGFFLTPLLLEQVFHYGEAHVGVLQIARPLVFSIAAPIAGYTAVRIGERISIAFGVACVAFSMLLFAVVSHGAGDLLVLTALAMSGLGLGVCSPSIAATVANAVEDEWLGTASAALQMVGQVGQVAGIQLMETLQLSMSHDGLRPSFGTAYLVGGGVAVLGMVASLGIRRSVARPRADVLVPVH